MAQNPAAKPEYDLDNVKNIEPDHAEFLLEGENGKELVSCKPIPGAEKMPPDKVNIAPHRTVRVYELGDNRDEEYVLVTCLLRGGDGPGGILIDRAIVFDGEVGDMLDHLLQAFDEGDWSRGIKAIENIRAVEEFEYVAQFLREVSDVLEDASENRYAMDLWQEYMQNNDVSGHPSTVTDGPPKMQ